MDANSQRPKGDGVLSSLNVAIEALNLAKEVSVIAPAKAAFGSVSVLLTMIRVCFLLSCDYEFLVNMNPGLYDEQNQFCRTRAVLRRCM